MKIYIRLLFPLLLSLQSFGQVNSVEYYEDFDMINFTFRKPIINPRVPPFIKVYKNNEKPFRIEVFTKSRKNPIKVFEKIKYRDFDKCYISVSKFLQCTTIDTLISLENKLYEFRNCYSRAENLVNTQNILIYELLSNDTISLTYIDQYNLYDKPENVIMVDTVEELIPQKDYLYLSIENYLITDDSRNVSIRCVTRNRPGCENGVDRSWNYPTNGTIFWTLFNHHFWQVSQKK